MNKQEKVLTHLEYLINKDNTEINALFTNWQDGLQSEINLCEILLYQLMMENEDGYQLKIFSYYEK